MKKISEIAKIYNVTPNGVRYWIEKGLKFETVKEVGKKPYKVINEKDVKDFLKLTKEVK